DYVPYLEELKARGFNLTRTFSGTYREIPGTFKIQDNTLAPVGPDRFACPWARTDVAGAGDGGTKFDLGKWNEDYFHRLWSFVMHASALGIVVEMVLWCTVYNDELWSVNPMNPRNNVQGAGPESREKVLTLENGGLLPFQEALSRRVARTLMECDN